MKASLLALALALVSMPFSFGQDPAVPAASATTKHHKKHTRKPDATAAGVKKHRKDKAAGDTSGTDASIATHSTNTAPLKQ